MSRKCCVAVLAMFACMSMVMAQNGTISCVGNFNLSLNTCNTEITPEMISAGPLDPAFTYTVLLRDEHGDDLPSSPMVNGDQKGEEISYTLVNDSTGNSCWGVLVVEDKIAPIIAGCETGVVELEPIGCFEFANVDSIINMLVSDNCDPNPDVVILDELITQDFCDGDILKVVDITIRATDNCDNESPPCRLVIPLERAPVEILDTLAADTSGIVVPEDIIVLCEDVNATDFPENLDFNGNPNPVTLSGVPVYQVDPTTQFDIFPADEAAGHCKLNVVYADSVLVVSNCFTKIIRHWTVIESCIIDPVDITFIQNITIMDMEAPTIAGVPNKLNFSTNTGSSEECAAITPVPVPTLMDNCQDQDELSLFVSIIRDSVATIPILYTGQPLTFQEGQNELVYIGTDACFNSDVQGVNEVRDTVDVWVQDDAPPVCEIDGKAITINNDTGNVLVPANIFDDGSFDDCSKKIKIYANRQDNNCDCEPEDALKRYSDFVFLGSRRGSDYYLSENEVIAPKALNLAIAMGGVVASFENAIERNFVRRQIEEYISRVNPSIDELTYFATEDGQSFSSSLGWNVDLDIEFLMGTTGVTRLQPYDGLTIEKRFVVEVTDRCGFSENIRFCCLDVIDGAPVEFRTVDEWGNFNTCELVVDIQDKVAPVIQCPPMDTIFCSDFTAGMDLTVFGMPTSIDACPARITELDSQSDISTCNTGLITRNFQIESGTGTDTCSQVIYVRAVPLDSLETPIDPLDINLPEDGPALGIDNNDLMCFEDLALLDPTGFPDEYVPQFTDNRVCSDLGISFEDVVFEVPGAGPNTCFKVVRTWTIVDACDPDGIDTLYTHDQSIVISNSVPPTITFRTAPTEICNEFGPNFMCPSEDFDIVIRVTDDCTSRANLEVTYFLDLECNGSFEDIGLLPGNRINLGDLPVGTHKVIVEAVDACNNVSSNTHTFDVINCVDPVAACQALTTPLHCFPDPPTSPINNNMVLMASEEDIDCDKDGMIDDEDLFVYQCAQAAWFVPSDADKLHPCGLPVVFSFSADTTDVERCFTCADLRCPQEVTIFFTDEFGNSDICVSTITLTDPKGLCPALQDCIIPPMVETADLDTICLAGGALPADLSGFGIDAPTIDATCCNDPDNSIEFEDVRLAADANGCRVIRRTWTVMTDCGCPVVEEFVQLITVRNDEDPSLICPDDVTVEATLNNNANRNCGTRIDLDPAQAADNCQTNLVITNDLRPASGANIPDTRFDLGEPTIITYTATNECGLTSTCSTTVIVEDNTPPIINCAAGPINIELENMSVTLDSDEVLDLIFTSDPTDVCGIQDIIVDPPTLDCANVNTPVSVTITVVDENGNESMCTVDITAVDSVTPTLTCPDDLTVNVTNTDNGNCFYTADDSLDATAMFNCDFDIVHSIDGTGTEITNGDGGSIAGTTLNLGEHTVTYTLTNGTDMIQCDFVVTVVDEEVPMITCPDDDVLILNQNCLANVPRVRYRRDVEIDNNCTSSIGLPDLELIPDIRSLTGVMTQTFTVNALDNDGNVLASCMFNVSTVDQIAPTANCPNGTQMAVAVEDDCRPRIPELGSGTDNCDGELPVLIANGAGPRVYQVPRAGRIWDGMSPVLVIAVDASGNRDTCSVMLSAVCPGEENAPEFQQQIQDISADSSDDCDASINVPFQVEYCIPANLEVTATIAPNDANINLMVNSTGANGNLIEYIITGMIPTGSYTVTVTAEDPGCVSTTQEFNVTIVATGGAPATFECKKIVMPIGTDGTATFLASDIVCVTGGNQCDGSNPTIIAAFSNDPNDNARTFTCADINPGSAVGTDIQVTMFTFDVADFDNDGTLDTMFREPCFVIQTITGELCPFASSSALNVGGRIFTEDNRGIENSSISLIGKEETQLSMTEEFGLYAFPSMPIGGSYTLTPTKEDTYDNGVSTLDIILIQKHILGIQSLDSPYKLIAADVNASGSLSALDLLELRRVILGLQDGFDNAPSWQMIGAEHQFLDPANPYAENYPETYDIASLEQNMFIDFIGVKMGDVNLSADPMVHVSAETRTSNVDMEFDMLPIVNGSELKYDFSVAQFTDIEGFQFTLHFDASRLTFGGIEGNLLDIDEQHIGVQLIDKGIITFSYDKVGGIGVLPDDVLFSLSFEHNGNLNADVSMNSSVVSAQLYSTENVYDLGGKVVASDNDIVLYQNTPNPWSESTEIGFMLPMEMKYELNFYSVSGQLLHTIERNGVSGLNSVHVYNDDINSNGLIYYELITPNEKTTRRMILLN